MVWNEKLKREIPDEWNCEPIGEFIDLLDSKRIPLSSQERGVRQGKYPYYGATGIMDYVDDYLFDEDIILLAEDGSTSDSNGNPIVQYVWGKVWVNNHAHIILPKCRSQKVYLYFLLKTIQAKKIESGSIQKKISQANLCNHFSIIPPNRIITAYTEVVNPIWLEWKRKQDEIKILTAQRDELLPLLMNGQVSVRPRAVNCDLSFMYRPVDSSCQMIRRPLFGWAAAPGRERYVANNA